MSESENGRLKCMITYGNEEEINYKKVSDITVMSNCKIIVDDSTVFKNIYNNADMLLYLMENLQMLHNLKLVVSDEFYKEYLKEHKTTLYNYFDDHKGSINASKPFIHTTSHLHQYSKRLSSDAERLIIKDITTTTSSSTQNNSIASLNKNVTANKGVRSKFNNRTLKLLSLCNLASKSRNNNISTNSVSKVPNHLLTYSKSFASGIPNLPDDNQTIPPLIVQHPTTTCNIQLPIAIKKKRFNK